jgi:hypothetical protein
MTFRQTARGIGIRALVLVVGLVLIGAWIVFEMIGAALQLLLWIGIALVVVGAFVVVRHKMRR